MLRRISLSIALAALAMVPAQAGDPVPGVDVLLEQIPGGAIYTARTDADGNIVFDDLPQGQYRVFQEIERPTISVSGPAVFTPADGDDIGTLTVTRRAPITIDRIVARRLSATEAARADAIPLAAEDANSTRSNNGGIAAPGDISAEDAERDAVPMAESLNTTRSNTGGIAAPGDISAETAERDAVPLSAESLNSSRSNSGEVVRVDESAVRELLRSRELRRLLVPSEGTDEASETAADDG